MTRLVALLVVGLLVPLAPDVDADELGVVKFTRKAEGSESIAPAIFPHGVHQTAFKCAACHDDIFPMKAESVEITMEMIQDGKSCGVCHNGTIAFPSSFSTCTRCHRE